MKPTTFFSLTLAIALCASSAMADGRKPGSKLVFPVHRSGATMFTIVCVTNTNTAPATPTSFGGGTNVHFEYANVVPNPADACRPLGCIVFDRVEYLTPADTLSVLTSCHNATAAGGQEGYLVVTAQSPYVFNSDWCHDHLIGSEMVVNASGSVYAINAAALRCFEEPEVPCVLLQPCNGQLYECLPHCLMDSFIALAGSQLALVSATDDDPNIVRDLYFEVWNDNEFALSATKRMNCWFDVP
ncbi:MAG: hypothetical protein KDB80_09215, partial [Planctomycetes bacterium]|nr:hypothetical protein [Planctomycetota bacterium]